MPAMADESIIVKQQGTIFLGGPPLVSMALYNSLITLGPIHVHVADQISFVHSTCCRICKNKFKQPNERCSDLVFGTLGNTSSTLGSRHYSTQVYTCKWILANLMLEEYLHPAESGNTRIRGLVVWTLWPDAYLTCDSHYRILKGSCMIQGLAIIRYRPIVLLYMGA